MRKKLIALVALIAITAIMLTGCGLFVVNAERDYNQQIGVVTYNGMTAYVYKGDLVAQFNQNISYVQNNYMTAETLLESLSTSLARRELLLLKAREHFAAQLNISKDADLEKFLGYDEIRYARAVTNDTFQQSIDNLVTANINKDKLNSGETDDEDEEETVAARLQSTRKWYTDGFKADASIVASDLDALFPDIAANFTDKYEVDAWKQFQKNNLQYRDYSYYYNRQLGEMLISKFQKDVNKDVTVTDAEIQERYQKIINQNLTSVIDEATYKTAFEGTNYLLYNKYKGFSKVRSILLQFNEGQTAMIATLKAEYGDNTDAYKAARERLAMDFGSYIYGEAAGVSVNISNPDYDANKPKNDTDNKFYSEENVEYSEIIERISVDIAKAEAAATTAEEKTQARIDAFDKWLYLVNDDPGMYNTSSNNTLNTYTVSPEGVSVSTSGTETGYVEEYQELARALALNGGRGNCYLETFELEKIGAYKADDVNYTSESGDATAEGIAYTINDYGVQIIMVVDYPLPDKAENVTEIMEDEKVVAYQMGLDFLYDIENKLTVRDAIRETLLTEKNTDNYNSYERTFFDEFEEASIKTNTKAYNQLLKEILEAVG